MPLLLLLPPSTSPPTSSGGWGTGGWGTGFWGGAGAGTTDDPGLQNLSFEDPGTLDGDAEFWTAFAYDPAGDYAAWDALYGWEDFETWAVDHAPLTDGTTTVSRFLIREDGAATTTTTFESMGSGWTGTDTFITEVGNSEDATFGDDDVAYEDFDSFWDGTPLVEAVADGVDTVENFESDWGNTLYITDLLSPPASSLTAAQFGTEFGLVDYDDFEGFKAKVVGTASAADDVITVAAYSFAAGERVTLKFEGIPPGGLQELRTYFVNPMTATTFELLDASSSTVDITSDGTNPLTVLPDGTLYWYDSL